MNNPSFINSNINISINNKSYSIVYSYKEDSTFQDLLEYFSYLCPSLNLCQCYDFKAAQDNIPYNQYQTISKKFKISDYTSYLNNLILYTEHNNCEHINNNFLLNSKLDIYSAYLKEKNRVLKDLQKKNELLIQGINGDLDKINNLKNLEIKVEENNNNITKQEVKNFYDVIVHIDSIKNINKGWKIDMSQEAEKNYQEYKNQKVLKIGVIGNANKGKSFLLSKISKMNFHSDMRIKTEGLSIKFSDLKLFKDRKIALLDLAAQETSLSILDNERYRDKLMTEFFLQNYIINNSDILIVVVGFLTISEYKLLMKVKHEMERMGRTKRKIPLYIIHNLRALTTKEQIDDYIKNTLLKSATFTLEKGHNISTKLDKNSEVYNYYEIGQDKEQKIIHLIYANEGSPAGKIYNQYALDFIENSYQDIPGLQPFDVIETIKERYIKVSKDIIEKTEKEEKLTMDSFDNSVPNLIKLKGDNEIILKKCLIDELGFSSFFSKSFEPKDNIN